MKYAEYTGWVGTFAVLLSYSLLALDIIPPDARYHSLVLVGSIGLLFICYKKRTWQPFVINIVFGCLAIYALLKTFI